MAAIDPSSQRMMLGIAHALFINRLHLLRLTEVVRLGVTPDDEDGTMQVPAALDRELKEQALNFVLTCLPRDFHEHIEQVQSDWLQPA